MSMKDKTKGVVAALRLDSHHAIQRFGALAAFLAATLVMLLVLTLTSSIAASRSSLDAKAVYTPTFTSSKSQQSGEVDGVYVSPDRTRALVMMQFDDTSGVSSDAANYQAFATGSTESLSTQALKTQVDGDIVVFGSTGYMGVVLESDAPFEQQIVSLTVRANSELNYTEDGSARVADHLKDDASFAAHDQWRLFINPGASETIESQALVTPVFNAEEVFYDAVIADQEAEVRKGLDSSLDQLRIDLARIEERKTEMARTNVDGVRIAPPREPAAISGDEVVGQPATAETESSLELVTDWVHPRGFDFDWRNGSVKEGYLDEVVPEGETYSSFLMEREKNTSSNEGSFQASDLQWKLTDGTDLAQASGTGVLKPLVDVMSALTTEYQNYYRHKVDYQTKGYDELLNLEVALRNVGSSQSMNTTDEALVTY